MTEQKKWDDEPNSLSSEWFGDKSRRHRAYVRDRKDPNDPHGVKLVDEEHTTSERARRRRYLGGWAGLMDDTRAKYQRLGMTKETYDGGAKIPRPSDSRNAQKLRESRARRGIVSKKQKEEAEKGRKKLTRLPHEAKGQYRA